MTTASMRIFVCQTKILTNVVIFLIVVSNVDLLQQLIPLIAVISPLSNSRHSSGKTLMPCSSYRQPRIFGFI